MGDVRKIPSRATGEFRAADMDCVDADEERLHSESTLITSVDSISASTADDPYIVHLVIRWNCRAGSNGCHKEYNRIRSFRFFFGIIRHGHYNVRCRTSWNFFSSFLSWLMLKGRKLILWLHVEGVTLTVSTFHPMPIEKDPAG
jgi:hypothetical protein